MSKVVRKAVEQTDILNPSDEYDDEVIEAGFDKDSGRATAILEIGTCLSHLQVETIRDSDTWELDYVSAQTDDLLAAHLIETMDQED